MKNLERLVMTRALVKEEIRQGKWNQGDWATALERDPETGFKKVTCGTTACVAGWAVITDGAQFVNAEQVLARPEEVADPGVYTDWGWVYPNGEEKMVDTISVAYRAERLLGLTRSEASVLFAAHNTEEDVMGLLKHHIKDARRQRREAQTGENA